MSELNDFQKWCKEILPIVQAASNGDVIEARFRGNTGEKTWVESQCDWECFGRSREYRIKPRTIKVNGFEITAPMSEAPKEGVEFFVASPAAEEFHAYFEWEREESDTDWLSRGICHATKEAAIAHAKAMLGIDPNGGEE